MQKIPFVDLKAQYATVKADIDKAVMDTIRETAFIMGERVSSFENEFAAYCGTRFGISCSSGTSALHLAMLGCGVTAGDEVIVPSHTFIATAEAVCHCGATPVFVDVDPKTYTMDPGGFEKAITRKTRAVVPVHIYGQSADMDPILAIAKAHKLKVVEDCAQSHGADYQGRRTGTMGDFSAFSFFPGKNLGAYGDGGIVVTDDEAGALRLRMLANHGRTKKFESEYVGYNYRMDAMQAAILRVKLPHLDRWAQARRRVAHRYNELLKGLPVETPTEKFGHVYHLYVIQSDDRDRLAQALKDKGIDTGLHYPIPVHLQPCFRGLPTAGAGKFPVTERLVKRILSLPVYPEMTDEQQHQVAEAIRASGAV